MREFRRNYARRREVFTCPLGLRPGAVARTYAAYGGVYITVALAWLSPVESHRPNRRDIIVARMSLIEVSIIILGNRGE